MSHISNRYGVVFFNIFFRLKLLERIHVFKSYIIIFYRIEVLVHSESCTDTTTASPSLENCLIASHQWLETVLASKLIAWSGAASQSDKGLRKEQSLSCVNIETYNEVYHQLKKKYGPYFVEVK